MGNRQATHQALGNKEIQSFLASFLQGNFSVRLPEGNTGPSGKIAGLLNQIIAVNEKMEKEFKRIGSAVGKEGKITQRASIGDYGGGWAASTEALNTLIGDVVQPSTEVARVIGAVAKGDLTQTMALEVDGRPLK